MSRGSAATSQLWDLYQTRLIVCAALLEGIVFFWVVVYLVEHSPWAIAAALLLIIALVMHLPTRADTERWLWEQARLVAEDPHLAVGANRD
ncbi:MAG: hypothetical protein ACOY3P_10555 [Planctomycetota bacterium]